MASSTGQFKVLTAHESTQFDSLRGASAMAVVLGHANQLLIAPVCGNASPYLGLLAQSAVMVFFVLSGFLIAKSISRNIVKNQGQFSLMKYTGDRVIRIWPPLLFSIILVILLCHAAHLIFPSDSLARQRLT